MNLPDIQQRLRKFAEDRNWEQFHSPKNLSMALAGEGNEVVLTGAAPVWLYLKIAHALHGKAKKLIYRSPVTGDVVIFDHSPY